MILYIPGPIIALATFPGVIMHEISHRFVCDILHVPVYDVRYFLFSRSKSGYVQHQLTNNVTHDLLIGFAPLFINSLFCMLFTLPLSASFHTMGEPSYLLSSLFLFWVGISMGVHAFPSNQDVHNAFVTSRNIQTSFFVGLLYYIMKVLNLLRIVWFGFLYAAVLSCILPRLIFGYNYIYF